MLVFFLRSLVLLGLGANAAVLTPPLSTAGADIVDVKGDKVQLKCVNWYGAQLHQLVPSGLDQQPLDSIAAIISEDLSLNCVRLVYALEMVRRGSNFVENATSLLAANPTLQSLNYMDVFDATVAALTERGLVVILNNHNSDGSWCCHDDDRNGLWYTDTYPEWEWLAHLDALTRRSFLKCVTTLLGCKVLASVSHE
jgi:aryl-phospho-beta-D-glucosidase BglC (GH1 family)